MIELGDLVRDRISGYEGIVIGITDWLYGCRRPMVQATALKDGKPVDAQSFDEPQLEIVKRAVIAAPSVAAPAPARTGGPRPVPRRWNDEA